MRTQEPPAAIVNAARKALSSLDPQLPFSVVMTMREQLSESLWQERLLAVLAGIFSVISVLMAGTGLYGLLSYDASQRTREFGIRSAVSAQKKDVAALLLKERARILVPGHGHRIIGLPVPGSHYRVGPLRHQAVRFFVLRWRSADGWSHLHHRSPATNTPCDEC